MQIDGALTVAQLVAVLGEVKGRKRLQKLVHLLRAKGHTDFKQRFILHYFGPFSRELAAQLDFLCSAELVMEEKPSETNSSYTYSSPPENANTSDLGAQETPCWVDDARRLNGEETTILEATSTLVYLHSRGAQGDDLKHQFHETKPQLKHEFDKAKILAKELSLLG